MTGAVRFLPNDCNFWTSGQFKRGVAHNFPRRLCALAIFCILGGRGAKHIAAPACTLTLFKGHRRDLKKETSIVQSMCLCFRSHLSCHVEGVEGIPTQVACQVLELLERGNLWFEVKNETGVTNTRCVGKGWLPGQLATKDVAPMLHLDLALTLNPRVENTWQDTGHLRCNLYQTLQQIDSMLKAVTKWWVFVAMFHAWHAASQSNNQCHNVSDYVKHVPPSLLHNQDMKHEHVGVS